MRVLIADDDAAFRTLLRTLVSADLGDVEIDEASNGLEAIECAVKCRPNVVLMDINMPVLNGIAAAQTIRTLVPDAVIVMVSGAHDAVEQTSRLQFELLGKADTTSETVANLLGG